MKIIIILIVNAGMLITTVHAEVFSEVLAGSFFEMPGFGSTYKSPADVSAPTKSLKTNKKI